MFCLAPGFVLRSCGSGDEVVNRGACDELFIKYHGHRRDPCAASFGRGFQTAFKNFRAQQINKTVKYLIFYSSLKATNLDELLNELKGLIIDGLNLENVEPDQIEPGAPLFGDGLGLDSIDALEIAVLLDRKYGVKISSGDSRNPSIFANLNALAEFVAANRLR